MVRLRCLARIRASEEDFEACPGDEPPPPTALEVYRTYRAPSAAEEIRRLGVNESLDGLEEIVGGDGLARLQDAQKSLRESNPASELVIARYPDTGSYILASQHRQPDETSTARFSRRQEDSPPQEVPPSHAVRPSPQQSWLSRFKPDFPRKSPPPEPIREAPLPVVLPWVEVTNGYLPVEARVFMGGDPALFLSLSGFTSEEPKLTMQGLELKHSRGQVDRLLRGLALLREVAPVGRKPLEETEWSEWRQRATEGLNLKRKYPSLKWSAIARRLDVSEKTLRRYIHRLPVSDRF